MASASASDVFNCSQAEFFKIISDFDKYPEFLPEVKACRVVEIQGQRKLVEFEISVIKTFKYRLWMTEEAPSGIRWELSDGDLFKKSDGSWVLSDEAGKTRATYTVDVDFKVFGASAFANTLVNVNLPSMMSAYKKRVSELYGR